MFFFNFSHLLWSHFWAVKPGDSGVGIVYQVDEFTSTHSVEYFIAQSHIYPSFTGKVSTLIYFTLEPGCEDYFFCTKQSKTFTWSSFYPHRLLSAYQNWSYLVMRMMPRLLQSPQGVYAWWVPILIIVDCSLPIASNVIHYGTRIGHYFYLYHRQVKCQPLSEFIIFLLSKTIWIQGFFATW